MLAALARRSLGARAFGTFPTRLAEVVTTYNRNPATYKPLARVVDGFKTYKPITPSIRHLRRPISPHLYTGGPVRELTIPLRKKGGRNCHGHITVRSIGGGHRRRLRNVDFWRNRAGPADVIRIEYDPGRSGHIALIKHREVPVGVAPYSYILACEGMRAGDVVQSFKSGIPDGMVPGYVDSPEKRMGDMETTPGQAPSTATQLSLGVLRNMTVRPGNVLPLRLIPTGTLIHCISLTPLGRASLVRSAGAFGQVVAHDDVGKNSQVKLQSGEVRLVLQTCSATIGKVSNADWKHRSLGKAGRSRWLGRRPHVRGVAMNACDHPHGGGRGKSKGNKHPRSIWGWLTKGKRTRKPGPKGHKGSNQMVVRERPRGKEKRS